MRVVQLIPDLGVGGAENMLLNLSGALTAMGHEVRVISLYSPRGSPIERSLETVATRTEYLGKQLGFDARMFVAVARALRSARPDVIHTHRAVLQYAIPALAALKRKPFVHTIHNVADREVPRVSRVAHRMAFGLGVAPVAIGTEVARSFSRVYGRAPAAVIPHGIPLQRYRDVALPRIEWRKREKLDAEMFVFVTAARLSPQKNLCALVEAFAMARHRGIDAMLLIAGDGPERGALERAVRENDVANSVRMLGARADIPDLLSACDAFVLSSLWEGNPLCVMEAQAAGKPVIATEVGGVPELLSDGETGVLVPSGNQRALADAMVRLVTNRTMRNGMAAAAARKATAEFDVRLMAERYTRLYECLAAGRRDVS